MCTIRLCKKMTGPGQAIISFKCYTTIKFMAWLFINDIFADQCKHNWLDCCVFFLFFTHKLFIMPDPANSKGPDEDCSPALDLNYLPNPNQFVLSSEDFKVPYSLH